MLKYVKFRVTVISLILFIISLQLIECNSCYTHNGIPKLLNLMNDVRSIRSDDAKKIDVNELKVGNEVEIFTPKFENMKTGLLSYSGSI